MTERLSAKPDTLDAAPTMIAVQAKCEVLDAQTEGGGTVWEAFSSTKPDAVLVLCAEGQSPDALMEELRSSRAQHRALRDALKNIGTLAYTTSETINSEDGRDFTPADVFEVLRRIESLSRAALAVPHPTQEQT